MKFFVCAEWVLEWFRFTIGQGRPNPEKFSNRDFEIHDVRPKRSWKITIILRVVFFYSRYLYLFDDFNKIWLIGQFEFKNVVGELGWNKLVLRNYRSFILKSIIAKC